MMSDARLAKAMKWVISRMFLLLALFLSLSNTSLAAGESTGHLTDTVTPHGRVDWTSGVVTATGIGIPPPNPASALQAREMTRTAAWSVALRNLLEALKGLYVDSTTTVSNYVTTNAEVRTRVEGMVQAAKVVQERELPTGEFETTVEMKLGGSFSQLIIPQAPEKSEPIKRFEQTPPPPKPPKSFTGLVIDARGTGAKACMAPRLLTAGGEEAYSPSYVEKADETEQNADDKYRIAWYVTGESAARAHPRVAANPLMIKAIRAEGEHRTDLVIHDADAQLIQLVPENFLMLKRARVLIILDPA